MKKNLHTIISIILVVTVGLFSSFPAFAQEGVTSVSYQSPVGISEYQSTTNSLSATTPKAFLVNSETGQSIELPIVVQQDIVAVELQETTYRNQYSILVPTSILESDMNERSKWDSSYSVYGTIRQYYSEKFYGSRRYVSVSKYQARWILYDSSVKMSSANMLLGCYGEFWDGGMCSKSITYSIGTPSSGIWYTKIPSWSGKYVEVSCDVCFQAGTSIVTLKRKTSTWKLKICVDEGNGC